MQSFIQWLDSASQFYQVSKLLSLLITKFNTTVIAGDVFLSLYY